MNMKKVAITNRNIFEESFPDAPGMEAYLNHIQRILPVVDFLVLREKDLDEEEYEKLAEQVLPLCREAKVPCAIHNHPETARRLGCGYLHLPIPELEKYVKERSQWKNDGESHSKENYPAEMPLRENLSEENHSKESYPAETPLGENYLTENPLQKIRIGTSVHSVEEAVRAERLGASYLFAGHIFETDCKKGLAPRGLSFLEEVCKSVSIPVYALGGINDQTEPLVRKTGAEGACRMSDYMKYRRAMIISGGEECPVPVPEKDAYVIACDKGYFYAKNQGIVPDLVLGDFDSFPGGIQEVRKQLAESEEVSGAAGENELENGKQPAEDGEAIEVAGVKGENEPEKGKQPHLETLPAEKDDTDTMLAARYVVAMGFDEVLITCCLGGRVDHLFANLQMAAYLASEKVRVHLQGKDCDIYCIQNGSISLKRQENRYLSVFSAGDAARDVTLRGTKYPLEHGTLTNTFPIGISNEWADEVAEISVGEGMLFIMCCGETSGAL